MGKFIIFILVAVFSSLSASCAFSAGPAQSEENGAVADDFSSLFERGKGLKAKGEYKEAAEYFESALKVSPEGRKEGVRVELATVLGWSGDYRGAINIFSDVIRKDPENLDARMGLAANLSWAKRYDEALDEYKTILEKKPGYTDALLGLARTLSWKGEFDEAVNTYNEVLAKDPGNRQARLGLAKTLFWQDKTDASLKEVDELIAREPSDKEAKELKGRLRDANRPAFGSYYSSSTDSDSNSLSVFRALGRLNFGPHLKLDLDYSLFEAKRFDEKRQAKTLSVRDTIRLTQGLKILPRLTLVRAGTDAGDKDYLAGGISLDWRPIVGTRVIAAYGLTPLLDTTRLIGNNIRVQEHSLALIHDLRGATLNIRAGWGRYSDGNSRSDISGGASYRLFKEPALIAGFTAGYSDFSKKTFSGYFNPPHILSNAVYLTLAGDFYNEIFEYDFTGTIGTQSFNAQTEYVSSFKARLAGRVTESLSVEAGYKWSRSALESAAGFRFEEYRVGLNYIF